MSFIVVDIETCLVFSQDQKNKIESRSSSAFTDRLGVDVDANESQTRSP